MKSRRVTIAACMALVLIACTDFRSIVEPAMDEIKPVEPTTTATADCGPDPNDPTPGPVDEPCNPGTGGGGGDPLPRTLQTIQNLAECKSGTDSDGDGLSDKCEYEVAWAFSPTMMVHPNDDVTRDEYFVVMPGAGNSIMIFYAFGYHRDNGIPFCACPEWLGGKHVGDSEFIVMEITPARGSDNEWGLVYAYLSAHRGRLTDSSVLAGGWNMETDDDGRPVVWVSEGKHANYISQSACDDGAGGFDSCDNNTESTRFWVSSDDNLGQINKRSFSSCGVPSRNRGLSRTECFWDYGKFYGWQKPRGGGAGAYSGFLSAFDFDKARATIHG